MHRPGGLAAAAGWCLADRRRIRDRVPRASTADEAFAFAFYTVAWLKHEDLTHPFTLIICIGRVQQLTGRIGRTIGTAANVRQVSCWTTFHAYPVERNGSDCQQAIYYVVYRLLVFCNAPPPRRQPVTFYFFLVDFVFSHCYIMGKRTVIAMDHESFSVDERWI